MKNIISLIALIVIPFTASAASAKPAEDVDSNIAKNYKTASAQQTYNFAVKRLEQEKAKQLLEIAEKYRSDLTKVKSDALKAEDLPTAVLADAKLKDLQAALEKLRPVMTGTSEKKPEPPEKEYKGMAKEITDTLRDNPSIPKEVRSFLKDYADRKVAYYCPKNGLGIFLNEEGVPEGYDSKGLLRRVTPNVFKLEGDKVTLGKSVALFDTFKNGGFILVYGGATIMEMKIVPISEALEKRGPEAKAPKKPEVKKDSNGNEYEDTVFGRRVK